MAARPDNSSSSPNAPDLLPYIESLEKKIAKMGRHDLDALARAGVPRQAMLRLLAVRAGSAGDRMPGLIKPMRARTVELKRLASQLEALARDVERAIDAPEMRIRFWAYNLGHSFYIEPTEGLTWKSEAGVPLLPSDMRALAQRFRGEVKQFTKALRAYGRKDSQGHIGFVLFQIWLCRLRHGAQVSDGPDCLDKVARLLTDAFEAAGRNKYGQPATQRPEQANPKEPPRDKCFTADGLRQIWKRGIGKRLQNF